MSEDPRIQGAQSADRDMADRIELLLSESERAMAITGLADEDRAWVEGRHRRITRVVHRLRAASTGDGGVPIE